MHWKRIHFKELIVWIVLIFTTSALVAQNKIAISRRAPVSLDLSNVYNAGRKGQIMADNSQWLNYTVVVKHGDPKASISVDIDLGSVPEGLELYVEASKYKGFSHGKMGLPTGRIRLSNIPKVLIHNIRTSYTGAGIYEGHQLTFYFEITDYSKLEPGINPIYIQYTLNQQ